MPRKKHPEHDAQEYPMGVARKYSKDDPEHIRAEIDSWAAADPSYAAFIEGVRAELRGRDSSSKDISQPYRRPNFAEINV